MNTKLIMGKKNMLRFNFYYFETILKKEELFYRRAFHNCLGVITYTEVYPGNKTGQEVVLQFPKGIRFFSKANNKV